MSSGATPAHRMDTFDEVTTALIAGQTAPNTIALRLKIESLFAPPRILTIESSNTGRSCPPNPASSTRRGILQTLQLSADRSLARPQPIGYGSNALSP